MKRRDSLPASQMTEEDAYGLSMSLRRFDEEGLKSLK